MSLAEEARDLGHRPGGSCGVLKLLATLDPSEQAEVIEAIASLDISGPGLAKAIEKRGWLHTSYQTINRHRSRTCRCES